MITKKMIQEGYARGIITLIDSPNNDGVACLIGEHWFYFGGAATASFRSADEYMAVRSKEAIVKSIYITLKEFLDYSDIFGEEYRYYESYLQEQLDLKKEEATE